MEPANSSKRMNPESKARMLAGSRAGAQAVSREFGARITRKRFCDEVGIHPTTLRRWISAGVVNANLEEVLGIPTTTFDERDLERGKKIAALLKENRGEMSLRRAVSIVDGDERD